MGNNSGTSNETTPTPDGAGVDRLYEESPRRQPARFWLIALLSLVLHAALLVWVMVPDEQDAEAVEWLTLNLEQPPPPPPDTPEPTPPPPPQTNPQNLTTSDFDPNKPLQEEFTEPPGEDLDPGPPAQPQQPVQAVEPLTEPDPAPEREDPREPAASDDEATDDQPREQVTRPENFGPQGLSLDEITREREQARRTPEPTRRTSLDPRSPDFSLPDLFADSAQPTTSSPGDPFAFQVMNADGYNIMPYVLAMKSRFRSNWHIPALAYTGASGAVSYDFEVLKDGTIRNLEQAASTGLKPYERAAFNAIRQSNRLPPLPEDFPNETLIIRFAFLYNWRGELPRR